MPLRWGGGGGAGRGRCGGGAGAGVVVPGGRPSRPPWPGSMRSRRWSRASGGTCMRSSARRPGRSGGASAGCPGEWCTGTRGPATRCRAAPDTVTLIDWETGGLGLPVLDLGNCLIESLLDAQPSGSGSAGGAARGLRRVRGPECGRGPRRGWGLGGLVEPDEDRIAAVARGYASQRVLGAAERALLPAAVRFGACYVGAIHLLSGPGRRGAGASMDARLERLRNRVSVSEAVARLAAPHLAGGAGNGTLRPVACSQ